MLENKENLPFKYKNYCGTFTNELIIQTYAHFAREQINYYNPCLVLYDKACEAPLVPITDFLLNMKSYENLICASLTTSLLLPHFSI